MIIPFHSGEREELADFLIANIWEFHSGSGLTREMVVERVEKGFYGNAQTRTFWIVSDAGEKIGHIRIFDLSDDRSSTGAPLFDIRIAADHRGKGVGRDAVQWIADFIFTSYPWKTRIEATTRHDNIAMRKVLRRCGFAKEAHYRQAWGIADGRPVDCVGYALLRGDWERKSTTEVNWNDEEEWARS